MQVRELELEQEQKPAVKDPREPENHQNIHHYIFVCRPLRTVPRSTNISHYPPLPTTTSPTSMSDSRSVRLVIDST